MRTEPVATVPADVADAAAVVRTLADAYGLRADPLSVGRFLEKTVSSRVFLARLADGRDVVIKRSFWSSDVAAFEKAYETSEALRRRGVPLPQAFRMPAGGFVARDGETKTVALAYHEGAHFSGRPEEVAAAGAALGRFHAAGNAHLREHPGERTAIAAAIPTEKPYEESRRLWQTGLREELLAAHACSVPAVCAALRDHASALEEAMAAVDASGIAAPERPSGILHNDFHVNNGLYAPDGSFVIFLDIDQIGVGPFIWDVANTLASFVWLLRVCGDAARIEDTTRRFLATYHAAHPLPADEYLRIVDATRRWDLLRILRSLRRHRREDDRLPGLLPKIADRLIPRVLEAPDIFSFLTPQWLRDAFVAGAV